MPKDNIRELIQEIRLLRKDSVETNKSMVSLSFAMFFLVLAQIALTMFIQSAADKNLGMLILLGASVVFCVYIAYRYVKIPKNID